MARTKQTARMSTGGKAPGVSVVAQQKAEEEWKDHRNWRPGAKFDPVAKSLSYKAIQKQKIEKAWKHAVANRKEAVVERI